MTDREMLKHIYDRCCDTVIKYVPILKDNPHDRYAAGRLDSIRKIGVMLREQLGIDPLRKKETDPQASEHIVIKFDSALSGKNQEMDAKWVDEIYPVDVTRMLLTTKDGPDITCKGSIKFR